MRTIHTSLAVAFLVLALPASAQTIPDSLRPIEAEISARPETDLRVLERSRSLLRDCILTGDLRKADVVLAFMDARFDSSRVEVLTARERLLVELWVGRHQRVLADPQAASQFRSIDDPPEFSYRRPRLSVSNDLLLEDLLDHSRSHRAELLRLVQTTEVSPEEQDFLRLFVAFIIGPDPSQERGDESFRVRMNDEATEFLGVYPRTRFEPFVRRYMRWVLRNSPWGYGAGLGLGGVRLEGDLGRWFTSGLSMDIWGEVAYGSAYVLLHAMIGANSEVRNGFTYQQSWLPGTRISPSALVLAGGVMLPVGSSMVFTPHAGWAYVDFSSPQQERDDTGFDGKIDFGAAVVGVNVDLKVLNDSDVPEGVEPGYQLLRARFSLMMSQTHIPFAHGSIVSFSLSYGLFGRPVEREL